jgi:hypothetical protein
MESGIDVQAMMPYLSKQLGHSSVDGTQYYYHTAVTSTHLVRMLDKSSNIVIPKIDGDIIKNPVKKKIATSQERVSRRKPINPMNTIIKRAR